MKNEGCSGPRDQYPTHRSTQNTVVSGETERNTFVSPAAKEETRAELYSEGEMPAN